MTFEASIYAKGEALQRRIIPELKYSQSYYEEYLRQYTSGVQSWLDIGCGHNLLPTWRADAEKEIVSSVPLIVGVDCDFEALRKHKTIRNVLCADIGALPFRDQSFDLVTANMVVEHLDDPARQFREIARVLQAGGIFLFHTPNLRSYVTRVSKLLPDNVKKVLARKLEGRVEEDVYPTHYRANTDAAIRATAEQAGLEVVAMHFTMSTPVFATIPLLAAVELVYLRNLMRRPKLTPYRQTLICALRRPS